MNSEEANTPIEAQLVDVGDDSPAAAGARPTRSAAELIQSKGAVLAMLFLVTGAIGIPVLWINPNFSKTERVIWSLVVATYTAVLVTIAASVVMWCYRIIMGL